MDETLGEGMVCIEDVMLGGVGGEKSGERRREVGGGEHGWLFVIVHG